MLNSIRSVPKRHLPKCYMFSRNIRKVGGKWQKEAMWENLDVKADDYISLCLNDQLVDESKKDDTCR